MKLDIYQVDAFANAVFEGNPAGVCILDNWLPDVIMQAIAAEMNLAETAFVVKKGEDFRIRWFTPTTEVTLCGHATLASAHVLFEHLNHPRETIRFHSLSGILTASPTPNQNIALDFPQNPPSSIERPANIASILGGNPVECLATDKHLVVVYGDATEIEILSPNLAEVASLPYNGVIVTAPGNGNGYDFVSRFFGPAIGIDEDPVTGSAFTVITPYYQNRFGKSQFFARQVSKRGGDVHLQLEGERILISGRAITSLEGVMHLPG